MAGRLPGEDSAADADASILRDTLRCIFLSLLLFFKCKIIM